MEANQENVIVVHCKGGKGGFSHVTSHVTVTTCIQGARVPWYPHGWFGLVSLRVVTRAWPTSVTGERTKAGGQNVRGCRPPARADTCSIMGDIWQRWKDACHLPYLSDYGKSLFLDSTVIPIVFINSNNFKCMVAWYLKVLVKVTGLIGNLRYSSLMRRYSSIPFKIQARIR